MVREKRIARSTDVEVELIDAAHPDCKDFDSEEGGRWVTLCSAHGGFVQHSTWRLARQHLGHPEDWCPTCQEAEADAEDSNGGFSEEERQRGLETRRRRAEERRAAQTEAQRRKEEAEDLDRQYSHWVVNEPMTDRVYRPDEKEAWDVARAERTSALEAARRAKGARRQGEESLANLPKVKSKKEKKNRERLEAEVTAADEIVVAKEDVARIAGETTTRLARIAALRGHVVRGWKLVSRDGRRAIEKGDRVVFIPDDYLEADAFAEVGKTAP
jgi:hypothetical protein